MMNTNTNSASPLSRFVKNASSRDKKKVYKKVIAAATESQISIIKKAQSHV